MKNLKPYKGDAFLEYKGAVNRKNESPQKTKLKLIEPLVKTAYQNYKNNFDINALHLVSADCKFNDSKNELLTLYDYQNKAIRNIRENIKLQQIITIQTTCQYCTIDSVGTMDHILPQSIYPEFSINAHNLFPSCSKCNEYKSYIESSDEEKCFLNLFLDILPEEQYLFVKIFESYGSIDYEFYLNNNGKISSKLFLIIENHYKNLRLLSRMKDASRSYLSDFISSVRPHIKRSSIEYVKETAHESICEERLGYGFNYWKSVFKLALIESPIFWDLFN